MELGDMKLTCGIDIIPLENGLNQITYDLKKLDSTSASVNSDLERMSQQANRLAVNLGLIGASYALLNLAKQAPQVAPAMAAIDIAFLKLGMTLGSSLVPAFEEFANLINNLGTFAENNKPLIEALGDSVAGVFRVASDIMGLADKTLNITIIGDLKLEGILKTLIDKFGIDVLAYLIGSKIGGPVGGAIGVVAAEVSKPLSDLTGKNKNTVEDIYSLSGAVTGAIGGGIIGGPVGIAVGAGAGSSIGNYQSKGYLNPITDTMNTIAHFVGLFNKDIARKYFGLNMSSLSYGGGN